MAGDLETSVTVVMAVSSLMLFSAFYLVMVGWLQVFKLEGTLVTDGLYGVVRHLNTSA
jgi:protein-S-isoprenylcysteine O-methyltransferase Ste14